MDRPEHFHPAPAIGAYILTLGLANYLAWVYLETNFVETEGALLGLAVAFVALGTGGAIAPFFNSLRAGALVALIAITSVAFNIAQLATRSTVGTAISGDLQWAAILAIISLALIVGTSMCAKICSGQYQRMSLNGWVWTIPIFVITVTTALKSVATASSPELFQTATVTSSMTTALCVATALLASFSALASTLIFQAISNRPLQKLMSLLAVTLSLTAALAAVVIAAMSGLKLAAIDYFDFFHSASVALQGAALEAGISLLAGAITLAGFWILCRITSARKRQNVNGFTSM